MKTGDQFTRTGTSFGESGTVFTQTITITKIGPKRAYFDQVVTWTGADGVAMSRPDASWFDVKDIQNNLPPTGGYNTYINGEWQAI